MLTQLTLRGLLLDCLRDDLSPESWASQNMALSTEYKGIGGLSAILVATRVIRFNLTNPISHVIPGIGFISGLLRCLNIFSPAKMYTSDDYDDIWALCFQASIDMIPPTSWRRRNVGLHAELFPESQQALLRANLTNSPFRHANSTYSKRIDTLLRR